MAFFFLNRAVGFHHFDIWVTFHIEIDFAENLFLEKDKEISPEKNWSQPQIWKTVDGLKKKKKSMAQRQSTITTTERPTKTVAALKAGFKMVLKSSS